MNKLFSVFVFGLLLTISIATTFSLVQADDESSGLVATFGASIGDPNPFAGGDLINHEYGDLVSAKPLTVTFTNPDSLIPGGYFDAVEPDFQDDGAPLPGIDAVITPHDASGSLIFAPFNAFRGYEEGEFTFTGLCGGCSFVVTVIISDMDFFDSYGAPAKVDPLVETVFVTGNSADLGTVEALPLAPFPLGDSQTITTTLASPGIADGLGTLTIGFNEIFVWDESPSLWDTPGFGICTTDEVLIDFPIDGEIGTRCRGEEPGVRVEQISLALTVPVGGFNVPIDTSSLLLAGVQSISMWMIPVVIAGIGIGIFVIKRRN